MDLFSYLLGKQSGGGGGGDSHDWSLIGYSEEPQAIEEGYNYAVEIMENWDNTQTNLQNKFLSDNKLIFMPLVDTSSATSMYNTFSQCVGMISMPLLDTSKVTSMYGMFYNCHNLKSVPQFNTQNVTDVQTMFQSCASLQNVPQLNLSKVRYATNMFKSCAKLTDTSLDNILKMCANTTSAYKDTKTLKQLGFSANNYSVSKIEALPHYQDFTNAGWTIGY